jgi:hypothetical protein
MKLVEKVLNHKQNQKILWLFDEIDDEFQCSKMLQGLTLDAKQFQLASPNIYIFKADTRPSLEHNLSSFIALHIVILILKKK